MDKVHIIKYGCVDLPDDIVAVFRDWNDAVNFCRAAAEEQFTNAEFDKDDGYVIVEEFGKNEAVSGVSVARSDGGPEGYLFPVDWWHIVTEEVR